MKLIAKMRSILDCVRRPKKKEEDLCREAYIQLCSLEKVQTLADKLQLWNDVEEKKTCVIRVCFFIAPQHITYNVQGDLVQGDKCVQTQVNRVETGAIGAQVNKE